jgi:hypothetical protein
MIVFLYISYIGDGKLEEKRRIAVAPSNLRSIRTIVTQRISFAPFSKKNSERSLWFHKNDTDAAHILLRRFQKKEFRKECKQYWGTGC